MLKTVKQKFQFTFKFPPPSFFRKDASDNGLASSLFPNKHIPNEYTWELYYDDLKKHYPIKYFFFRTCVDTVKYNILRPLKDLKYWIVSHTIRRYHILDLRQPKENKCDEYRYGWRDVDTRILFAMFNLLNEFVKHELPNMYVPSEKECKLPDTFHMVNSAQRNSYFEIKELHHWWNVERKEDSKKIDNLMSQLYGTNKPKLDDKTTASLKKQLDALNKSFEHKEEDMMVRLIRVRKSLWT